MRRLIKSTGIKIAAVFLCIFLTGCSGGNGDKDITNDPDNPVAAPEDDKNADITPESTDIPDTTDIPADTGNNDHMEEKSMDYAEVFKNITLSKSYKGVANNNPIIEQHYGADPFALVYEDTVYFYMTADAYEYDANGEIKENSYSQIRSLYVVSTKDMINFTDHGEITIAGTNGATKWAHNSWAPAAAWKMVDGKPKSIS